MPDPIVTTPGAVTSSSSSPVTPPTSSTPTVPAGTVEGGKLTAGANPVAKSADPVKPATPSEVRKFKLKLDGADVELPEEEVIRLASMSGASQKKFLEAANLRKEVEQVIQLLKTNPAEAMKRIGHDPRKFSEEFLVEALKREAESPEQKKVREMDEKLKNYEKQEADRETAAKQKAEQDRIASVQKANAEKEQQIIEQYDKLFVDALAKSGLPKNARTVARMAELMRVNLKLKAKGEQHYTADQLAEKVRQDYDDEMKVRTTDLSGEQIIDMLNRVDPSLLKKANKALIAKLKGAPPKFTQSTEQAAPANDADKSVHESWGALRRRNRGFAAR